MRRIWVLVLAIVSMILLLCFLFLNPSRKPVRDVSQGKAAAPTPSPRIYIQ